MNMDFQNKVAVITGASRGLGKEIAILLAEQKAKLALVSRSEKVKELFDVITLGTIYVTTSVLPILKKQAEGQILNVVSVAGIETPGAEMGPYSPYTAAKYAVTGFTKSLEEELKGTKIKVMGIYPGGMNTPLFKKAGFDYTENENWMMDKKDVAKIILFMLSQPKDVIIDH